VSACPSCQPRWLNAYWRRCVLMSTQGLNNEEKPIIHIIEQVPIGPLTSKRNWLCSSSTAPSIDVNWAAGNHGRLEGRLHARFQGIYFAKISNSSELQNSSMPSRYETSFLDVAWTTVLPHCHSFSLPRTPTCHHITRRCLRQLAGDRLGSNLELSSMPDGVLSTRASPRILVAK
jgi:hypothetical protein